VSDVPPQQPYGEPPFSEGSGGYAPPPPPPPPPPPGYGSPPGGGGYPPPPAGYGAPGPYSAPPGPSAWTGPPLADWGSRVLATLIDSAIGLVIFFGILIVSLILGAVSSALGTLILVLGYIGIILGYNYIALGYWTGLTGQTIGKRTMGVKVVRLDDGQLLGPGTGIGRHLLHILDSFCLIGYLFPLWDPLRQTFADKIIRTVAIVVPKQPFSLELPR
jgi:uncharacterized RDD family membrane protein YckC